MKTLQKQLAVKFSDYWYNNLHGQISPITQKQALSNFIENELDKFTLTKYKNPKL